MTSPPPVPSLAHLPEIGPYLGRLTDATRRFDDPAIGLDQVRLTLISDLFERTHAARGFLSVGDQAGARAALDKTCWLEIWRTAARQAAQVTVAASRARILRAQALTGCPDRVVAPWLPSGEDGEMLLAKLEAAGIPLEEQVARGYPAGEGWWEAVRQTAVALEDSWEQLEHVVRAEVKEVASAVAQVERWRASLMPWVVAAGCLTLVAGWLGLVLGGFVPRPTWLDPVARWFWSLPWP